MIKHSTLHVGGGVTISHAEHLIKANSDQWMLVMSTQVIMVPSLPYGTPSDLGCLDPKLIGFSVGGLTRRVVRLQIIFSRMNAIDWLVTACRTSVDE